MHDDSRVDIERILEGIREEIEQKGLRNTVLPFEEVRATTFEAVTRYDPAQLAAFVAEMDRRKQVQAYRQLRTNRKVIGGAIIFVKKVIRKLTKFYIEPIVADQNAFNGAVVQGMQSLGAYANRSDDAQALWQAVRELRAENIALKARVRELETRADAGV